MPGSDFGVQCATCQCWFHGACVGLKSKHEVPARFTCLLCQVCATVFTECLRPDRCSPPCACLCVFVFVRV